ncbi:MAG: Holliday junction branch migration protein RuvA [Actinobacteria bacterium]|nr:Holliday junction branch migration protein RuvA [Actinomycetota bacterium]
MIDFVEGVLAEKSEEGAVISVGGLGLFLSLSHPTLQGLPSKGKKVKLLSYLHVKEDLLQLYGFSERGERDIFLKLIAVTGVGPKVALAVLSAYAPDAFVRIVASEDLDSITAISGIGKKSGQRIILELKDKLAPLAGELGIAIGGPDGSDLAREAREALKGLGYTTREANQALDGYAADDPSVEDMITYALKRLGGST